MNHFGKLTTMAATGTVALGLLLVPAAAGASSTTTTTTPPTQTTAPATTTKSATKPTTTGTTTTSTAHWTVLAGSFTTKADAATQLAQLRKLGFKHFHVVHSATHYLVRERHLHHSTATKLAAKLKSAGISATVQS